MTPLDRLRLWLARGMVKSAPFAVNLPWVTASLLEPSFRALTQEGYRRNAAFFACCSALAMSFPEPPLLAYDGEGDDATALPTHPARLLLRRPNPLMGEDELAVYVMLYLAIGGNAYLHKVRGKSGRVVELWPYHAGQISASPGGPTWIDHYDYDDGSGRVTAIPAEDIIHLKWPSIDPTQPWMAQPPLLAAAREVDTDNEVSRYLATLLKNDAVPRTLIMVPADTVLETDQKRRLKEQFVARYGGDHRGEPAVLDGGATVERLSLDLQELAFEALHRIPETRIAAALRVPPIVAGLNAGLERSTYSNYGESVKHFTLGTLVPLWRLTASAMQAGLAADFGGVILRHDLNTVQALQEDATARWTRIRDAFGAGYISVNEARRGIGYPDVPGGDEIKALAPPPTPPQIVMPPADNTQSDTMPQDGADVTP